MYAWLRMTICEGLSLGAVCLIVNTFLFALYNTLGKRWMHEISPLVLTSGTMISGAIGLVLLSLFDPMSQWKTLGLLHLTQWLAVLFLALFCSVFAYFTYNFALSKIEASRVAVYFYFEPLISLVLGVLLLGEQLAWQTVVGALIISSAVLAVQHMQH
jgi:drug/metabolite transporter (DMT)-like permease